MGSVYDALGADGAWVAVDFEGRVRGKVVCRGTNKPVSQSSAEAKPLADWLILTILADLLTYIAYKLLISYAQIIFVCKISRENLN